MSIDFAATFTPLFSRRECLLVGDQCADVVDNSRWHDHDRYARINVASSREANSQTKADVPISLSDQPKPGGVATTPSRNGESGQLTTDAQFMVRASPPRPTNATRLVDGTVRVVAVSKEDFGFNQTGIQAYSRLTR